MKNLLLVLGVLVAPALVHADDAPSPAVDTAKRKLKKGGHRVQEAVCAEGDAKCAAKKVKNRAQEGSDYVGDKVKENTK